MVEDWDFDKQQLIAASKILATLLRTKPSSSDLQSFFGLLEHENLSELWPSETPAKIEIAQRKLLSHPRDKELDLLWQNVMIGPQHLEAPPWGSVYLDHEQVVFGDSCVELAFFLKSIGIQLNTGMNEPEDHIGLMFWYIAGLLEKEEDAQLVTLLEEHLLPWSNRYTELLYTKAPHPFFEGLAALIKEHLEYLQHHYAVTPVEKKLYF